MLDTNQINSIATLPLNDAIHLALGMIDGMAFKKKPEKKVRLQMDIKKARNSTEIMTTMYNLFLSADGNAVSNSAWQRQYR